MQYQAVIFDMDGTLVNSEVLWIKQEGELLKRRGHEYTRDVQKMTLGMGIRDMILLFKERYPNFPESVDDLHEELVSYMLIEIRDNLEAKPAARELIEYVASQNIPYCIASGSSIQLIEAVLESQNWTDIMLRYFSSEQVERGKPSPDIFLYAAEQLGVKPEDCLVLEDSPNGVRAANSANMPVFAIPEHDDLVDTLNELTPHVFSDLPAILDHLRNT